MPRLSAKSSGIDKLKRLNATYNNLEYWRKHEKEFEDLKRNSTWNPNKTPTNEKIKQKYKINFDGDLSNIKHVFQMMASEQILHFLQLPAKINLDFVQLLKLSDANLYNRILKINKRVHISKKLGNLSLFITRLQVDCGQKSFVMS